MRILPPVTHGKHCPRCGGRTERVRTPVPLRPFRWIALRAASRRRCLGGACGWRGFALPEPVRALPEPRAPEPAHAGAHP